LAPVVPLETAPRPILILGSSSVTYGESGDPSTLPGLTERYLKERSPAHNWVCVSERLFYSAGMADRADKLVERHRPAVIVIYLQKSQFVSLKVVYQIRNRWPRMYEGSLAFAKWLKGLAGGGGYGAAGLRGWLFRAPVFVAEHVIGTAPEIWVDDAIKYTRETIERLAKQENITILCKMPKETSGTPKTERQLAWAARFRTELAATCESRRIPLFRSEDDRPPARRRWLRRRAEDGVHATPERREEQASVLADEVLAAAESASIRA
jgi:hypothetical protein